MSLLVLCLISCKIILYFDELNFSKNGKLVFMHNSETFKDKNYGFFPLNAMSLLDLIESSLCDREIKFEPTTIKWLSTRLNNSTYKGVKFKNS